MLRDGTEGWQRAGDRAVIAGGLREQMAREEGGLESVRIQPHRSILLWLAPLPSLQLSAAPQIPPAPLPALEPLVGGGES